jgi:peptide chain release factor
VGVALAPEPDLVPDLKAEDIDYQTLRASGPGGQHVNKTDSAVRATHRPTGLVATAQEQRSQHANRKLARLKLAMMIEEQRGASRDQARALSAPSPRSKVALSSCFTLDPNVDEPTLRRNRFLLPACAG